MDYKFELGESGWRKFIPQPLAAQRCLGWVIRVLFLFIGALLSWELIVWRCEISSTCGNYGEFEIIYILGALFFFSGFTVLTDFFLGVYFGWFFTLMLIGWRCENFSGCGNYEGIGDIILIWGSLFWFIWMLLFFFVNGFVVWLDSQDN